MPPASGKKNKMKRFVVFGAAAAATLVAVAEIPRDQLGSFANCPSLATVDIKGGWCIHSPDLNGALLDERLKLQLWTLRFEPL